MRCSAVTSFLAVFVFTAACLLAVHVKERVLADSHPLSATSSAPQHGDPAIRVWAKQNSGLYYCPDMELYGKDLDGAYLAETYALDHGYRPALGSTCLKHRR